MLNLEIMQKIAFKALLFSMMVAFVSCDNEEDSSAPFFQIEETSVNVRESGLFTRQIPLLTNIKKYDITVDATTGKDESGEYWCSAEVKDNLLVITCKENKVYDPRETDITVKPEGAQPVQVHVRQLGQAAIILVDSETDYALSILSQPIEVDIVSNVEYDIVTPEWINELPTTKAPETVTNTIKFEIDANEASEERVDTIYFKQSGIEEGSAKIAKVIVKQNANIPPPAIENSGAKSSVNMDAEASITISWDAFPEGSNIKNVEVSYVDPAQQVRAASEPIVELLPPTATSYTVSNTMKKYGEYVFTVRSISLLDNPGEPIEIRAVSKPVPHTPGDVIGETKIQLTADRLSSNAQEPNEGPIANLVDGNTATSNFFHTAWSVSIPGPHDITIDLGKEISDHFKIKTTPRNASNIPVDIDLYGSLDGDEWFFIRNVNKDGDAIPTTGNGAPFTSPTYRIMEAFRYLRYSVNKTNTNTTYWSMSEFEIWDVATEVLADPEAE